MDAIARLQELLDGGAVCVLTGAGISTESGIPDYRGPTGQLRVRLPMTIQEFRRSTQARRRYWARSHVGWRRMSQARPNAGHQAVAELQRAGRVAGIITQNVDGLHQAAGATGVIDLHGSLARVVCLGCGARSSRTELDDRLHAANGAPGWDESAALSHPDGDVALDEQRVARFTLVGCARCGADLLKPDVVFFGENVPRARVARCYELLERAASLVVLGSSLTVMSGLRFVRRAHELGIPVAIVNRGVTRGDALAELKLDAGLGETLTGLVSPGQRALRVGRPACEPLSRPR